MPSKEATAYEKIGATVSAAGVELLVTIVLSREAASFPTASCIAFASFPEVGSV